MNVHLVLETGDVFSGTAFGYSKCRVTGEVVFQTGMVGYTESLTDPSYKNQILVLTYPLIGNYGVPPDTRDKYGFLENYESEKIHASGLIVGEYVENYSHWNANRSLDEWLKEKGIPGISGIDTRELVKIIRTYGTLKGRIVYDGDEILHNDICVDMKNLAESVTVESVTEFNPGGDRKILVIDCGIKYNQLRMLLDRNVHVKLVPINYDFTESFYEEGFHGIFISNGPGDPEDCQILINRLGEFMAKDDETPIFGICLGHQILGLASGAKSYKMKFGNRGHNLPCQLVDTQKCYITTQNHGYAIDNSCLPDDWKELFTNANDGSNEGLYHETKPYFSVQFHPEASAGPMDTSFLFDLFLEGSISRLLEYRDDSKVKKYNKVLILGSGGLSIGQSGEFDYSGSQAIKAYKEEGLTTILINPNIATVQTSPGFADKVYFLPVNPEFVTKVIREERPDCITLSFGGQTALNCGIELDRSGVLSRYGVEILGTPVETVLVTEDRQLFKDKLLEYGEQVPEGFVTNNFEEGYGSALKIGFPVLVRSAFALGGLGSGFANNEKELSLLMKNALAYSKQVIVDKSLRGWKEVEYEIVRDRYDNCISVCNMENIDPLGVHTGESIVVAPSQTLTDEEYNMLRATGIQLVRALGVVGECNIQYALNPESKEYYVIEINARLSRSSALASKATGYPLAYVAAKLSLGYSLLELRNSITKSTTACFEPSLDYCVVKIPRWDLEKFPLVSTKIDSSMKSIGEAMAISRSFEESFQKALRMANENVLGFQPELVPCNDEELINPTYKRIFAIATGLYTGQYDIENINRLSCIDPWFLNKFKRIIDMHKDLERLEINRDILLASKRLGFSDSQIANCSKTIELAIRSMRQKAGIHPIVKQIDTVAGEFPCFTNYLYTTYNGNSSDVDFKDEQTLVVLGSGVYKIGSSVEFDWCSVNCIRELRELGYNVVVVNCNPETVSTDYDEADKLYFEEISFETVMDIYELEEPEGVVLSMGGQIPNNIAMPLYRQGVTVVGTSPEMIDRAENRYKFSRLLDSIDTDQPKWKELTSVEEAKAFCNKVGYPCLVRPSYVLSGVAMNVAYSDGDLEQYLGNAVSVSKDYPVVISKFIEDAKEVEVDAIASKGELVLTAVSEHVENAGVHSGDATLILPPQDLTTSTVEKIKRSTHKIARSLNINGPFNIQFIAKDEEVKVIECNLRVSRTFPFVSKTLGINFAKIATNVMLGTNAKIPQIEDSKNVGVKVPQFSFSRLKGADISLGVEMLSTGEVACFGVNHYEAYLKGLLSTDFKLPKKKILLSLGTFRFKNEFLEYGKTLLDLGYQLFGTHGTADFFNEQGIKMIELPLYSEKRTNKRTILDYLSNSKIDLVINTSEKNKIRCVDNSRTDGYRIRRTAIESSVPVITNIKCAKMLVSSLQYLIANVNSDLRIRSDVDCFTSYKTVRLPGLIDVHVHVRDPGSEYKEDWTSCTKSALAGGITTIFAMPNTNPPVTNEESLRLVKGLAKDKACCNYGIFVGANSENTGSIFKSADDSIALKMYLNNTFGPLLLENSLDWMEHVKNWPDNKPICVHAESKTLPAILHIAKLFNKHIHVCHVARKEEIEIIRISKLAGQNITCEVSPHHLFLEEKDLENLKCCGEVKPPLVTREDQQSLWDNIDIIDCFATDHAPHTLEDKHNKPTPGFPGLETALPLLLTAVNNGRLTLEDIIKRYHSNPKKIFGLDPDYGCDTFIEVDMSKEWVIGNKPLYSKCGWTPFAGWKVKGLVRKVVDKGNVVFIDGKVLAKPGSGKEVIGTRTYFMGESGRSEDLIDKPSVKQIVWPANELSIESASAEREVPRDNEKRAYKAIKLASILSVDQFNRDILRSIFEKASEMKLMVSKKRVLDTLKGKIMGSVFYEPSTRTRCSFTVAMRRLGGEVVEVGSNESSVRKGENLEDFVKTIEAYSDIVILRSPEVGAVEKAKSVMKKPVINAGDGSGEHPTQALLDVFTIREEIGTVNGLTITMVGDLKHGRTVHSLAKLLSLYQVRLRYVSPVELKMPKGVKGYIAKKGVEQIEYTNLEDVIETTDILYVTRIQKERFKSEEEYNKVKSLYRVTPQTLTKARPDVRVMHPLPRVDEISRDLDNDPRATYFRQMENGMYVRMGLLSMILGD